jgi:hypothetical protein
MSTGETCTYEVLRADGTYVEVQVEIRYPEHIGVRQACDQIHHAFGAKQKGCTGLVHNVHHGRYCPIHSEVIR